MVVCYCDGRDRLSDDIAVLYFLRSDFQKIAIRLKNRISHQTFYFGNNLIRESLSDLPDKVNATLSYKSFSSVNKLRRMVLL